MSHHFRNIDVLRVARRKSRRTFEVWKAHGIQGVFLHLKQAARHRRERKLSSSWLHRHGTLNDEKREALRTSIAELEYKPLISIVVPVYNVPEMWLRRCLDSVLNQLYQNWELCIADDHSSESHIRSVLEEYSTEDARIKMVFRPENGHISKASNSALELATGEFVVLLDHDDELSEDALFWVANELNDYPKCDMIYSDEDMIDERGVRYAPKFKPDWSHDLMYSLNLVTHLSAYRTALLNDIGGFREGFEGSQDYDLALRVSERIPEDHIRHIPRILYHWRAIRGSVAYSSEEKPYAHERAREAIRSHFHRLGKDATVTRGIHNLHRVSYTVPENGPKVAVIMHGKGDRISIRKSLEVLMKRTEYDNAEMIVSSEVNQLDKTKHGLAETLNLASSQLDSSILCFVETPAIPVSNDWLRELVGFAIQDEIGAVGSKVILKNGRVLHSGFIIGAGDTVANAHRGLTTSAQGNILRNVVTSNFSAVSVSCMVIRRELFEAAGGFDSKNLPSHLFDVDLCLKLREQGYRNVMVSDVKIVKAEKRAMFNFEERASNPERGYIAERWKKYIENDPFYNPNLSRIDGTFTVKL